MTGKDLRCATMAVLAGIGSAEGAIAGILLHTTTLFVTSLALAVGAAYFAWSVGRG